VTPNASTNPKRRVEEEVVEVELGEVEVQEIVWVEEGEDEERRVDGETENLVNLPSPTLLPSSYQALKVTLTCPCPSVPDVEVSSFRVVISHPLLHPFSLPLPTAILPSLSSASSPSPNTLSLILPIDKSSVGDKPDPGSNAALLEEALGREEEEEEEEKGGDERFNLQDTIDIPNGILASKKEGHEFPEDAFHSQDAMSMYIINQREEGRKNKEEEGDEEIKFENEEKDEIDELIEDIQREKPIEDENWDNLLL